MLKRANVFVFQIIAAIPLIIATLTLTVNDAQANRKYAAIVWDVTHNRVLYESAATHRRYPASLTKMMTLYMTFEALERGKLRLKQRLPVSKHAASMPPTNLRLRKGQRISVEDAIVSLVVRSANDAAAVLAEALSGTEWQFAVDMTNKARKLGMKHTVFRNASGLPDKRQRSTARDMATLALALQNRFPQYYHYFKRTQFTFNGRTYKTHNHVLKEYGGVDGIKTGYTRASGFNLATSAKRDGHHLIAVVMGGKTAKRRDNHMKVLLNRYFKKLVAQYGKNPAITSTIPRPVAKPGRSFSNIQVAGTPVPKTRPNSTRNADLLNRLSNASPEKPKTFPPRLAANPTSKRTSDTQWGVQIGAFSEPKEALIAAAHAMTLASGELRNSQIAIIPDGENTIHRARLANLTRQQAKAVCRKLRQHHESCFALPVDKRS